MFAICFLLCGALAMTTTLGKAQLIKGVSTLTVRVTGARNAKGNVHLVLYRDSQFVEIRVAEMDARTRSAQFVLERLPQGIYTVHVFHDENMNGKMDTNFVGMPREGYGMSNNPQKRMGKPGFDETNFQLNQPEATIEIKLIYW